MRDGERLAAVVAASIETATAPLLARIALLEQRQVPVGRDGQPGRDGLPGQPGKDAQLSAELITEIAAFRAEMKTRPSAQPIQAPIDSIELAGVVTAEVSKAVAALPPAKDGRDGVSVDQGALEAAIATHVTMAVSALPVPRDGKSVSVDDVRPLIVSEVLQAVRALPVAKDGAGVVGALIDRDGHLVVTLSDGVTKDVGHVVGRDVDQADLVRVIAEEVAKFPRPKDGIDGKDGFGFDDFGITHDGDRGFTFRWTQGERVKEQPFTIPFLLDRGVFKPETAYVKGDGVTWGGSFWIAKEDTSATPDEHGEGSRAWRLAVKRGREGRHGKDGAPGPEGKPGTPGRDGTKTW